MTTFDTLAFVWPEFAPSTDDLFPLPPPSSSETDVHFYTEYPARIAYVKQPLRMPTDCLLNTVKVLYDGVELERCHKGHGVFAVRPTSRTIRFACSILHKRGRPKKHEPEACHLTLSWQSAELPDMKCTMPVRLLAGSLGK